MRLASTIVPGVDRQDVVLRGPHRDHAQGESVRRGRIRLREALLDLELVVLLQHDATRQRRVPEDHEVRALLNHDEVLVGRDTGHALERKRGSGREVQHQRGILIGDLARILRVLKQLRGLHDGAARGERQLDLVVRQRLKLLGGLFLLRRYNLLSLLLPPLLRDDHSLTGLPGLHLPHLGAGHSVTGRGLRSLDPLLGLGLRGRVLLPAERVPHPPREREAQQNRNQFLLLIHRFSHQSNNPTIKHSEIQAFSSKWFFQLPLGGTGSYPWAPNGWHRRIRQAARIVPFSAPCTFNASIA